MDFRTLAFLAIWTLISGPIFSGPATPAKSSVKAAKAVKVHKARR
jgi:hypothetical protein